MLSIFNEFISNCKLINPTSDYSTFLKTCVKELIILIVADVQK